MAQPFFWGSGGEQLSYAQAKKRREVADALAAKGSTPQTFGAGLNRIGEALLAKSYGDQATAAETAGADSRKAVIDALLGNPDPTMSDIASAFSNDWVANDPGSSAVVQALMQREGQQAGWARDDALLADQRAYDQPVRDADLAYRQAQTDALLAKPAIPLTDDQREYELAVSQGYDGSFVDYLTQMKKAGATSISNVVGGDGAPGLGKLSTDYGYVLDPETGQPVIDPTTGLPTAAAVPGTPAALQADAANAKADMQANMTAVSSDTVVNEAAKARDLISGWTTGAGQWAFGSIPFGPQAELKRHVSALQSIAAAENLNQMRQASPTGGALGNASDADIQLLKDKAGALDPLSPNFPELLDDYERTLLRIVHGPKVGDAIFEQSRPGPRQISTPEEFEALPSGTEFVAPDGSVRVKP